MPDAKRDNPYDPKSEGFLENDGLVAGKVTHLYPPYEGIEGVVISLSAPGGSAISGGDGLYSILHVLPGQYGVTAHREGYAPDSTTAEIVAGQSYSANFSLDALPNVSDASITSEHSRTSLGQDVFSFHFDIQVKDFDGIFDMESVTVSIPVFGFHKELTHVLNTDRYHLTLSPEEITDGPPEILVGKQLIFTAWDRIGNKTISDPESLVRIIYSLPSTVTPNEEEKMDARRLLVWESFADSVDFRFTYTVDVLSAFSSGWNRESIPSDTTSVTVTEPLDIQSLYRWSVWIVDEYGNTAKSFYVTFSIEGGP
jgi:hypothetical protein